MHQHPPVPPQGGTATQNYTPPAHQGGTATQKARGGYGTLILNIYLKKWHDGIRFWSGCRYY